MTTDVCVVGVGAVCEKMTLCRKPVSALKPMNCWIFRTDLPWHFLSWSPCERLNNSHSPRIHADVSLLPRPNEAYLFPAASIKDTDDCEAHLTLLLLVCSVFPGWDCLLFPLWADRLRLWGCRERMCYSSSTGGWSIISVEHRVAFHMDFPSGLRLFVQYESLLRTVNTALCLSAGPFCVCWVPLSGLLLPCQPACPPAPSRVTRLYPPPVSGIFSFLFSCCAEPVL